LVDLATNLGIVKKSGAWFTYDEDRFQGREQFKQKLIEIPGMSEKLMKEVKTKLGMVKDEKEAAEEKPPTKEKKSSK
jgi:recombination protein RecA